LQTLTCWSSADISSWFRLKVNKLSQTFDITVSTKNCFFLKNIYWGDCSPAAPAPLSFATGTDINGDYRTGHPRTVKTDRGPDLGGRRFKNTEAVEMVVHEWLHMEQPGFHRYEIAGSYQYGRDASPCSECRTEAMKIRWKKCAEFNGVMTSDFIYMTQ
jgi:hypothetical protein